MLGPQYRLPTPNLQRAPKKPSLRPKLRTFLTVSPGAGSLRIQLREKKVTPPPPNKNLLPGLLLLPWEGKEAPSPHGQPQTGTLPGGPIAAANKSSPLPLLSPQTYVPPSVRIPPTRFSGWGLSPAWIPAPCPQRFPCSFKALSGMAGAGALGGPESRGGEIRVRPPQVEPSLGRLVFSQLEARPPGGSPAWSGVGLPQLRQPDRAAGAGGGAPGPSPACSSAGSRASAPGAQRPRAQLGRASRQLGLPPPPIPFGLRKWARVCMS